VADFKLEDLEAALAAEGVVLDHDALARAWRKLTNPGGCEHCGQHVKVGIYVSAKTGKVTDGIGPGRKYVTACCRKDI
jgi:hypothetical protein